VLVERQHHRGIDAGLLEQLEPLLVIGEQLGRRLRAHDRRRMRSNVTTADLALRSAAIARTCAITA
jgi:hypothetical protein